MPLAGKRLLVVSADGELARLVADASSCHGASLVPCSGGRAALDEADAHGADAVIVDLPVADFRSDALLIALRRRGLKTVAVSGVLPAARYAATALRFGAEAFLEKPVDVQEVLAALSKALLPAAAGPAQTATPDPAPALIESPTPSPALSPSPTPALTPSPVPALTPFPFLTPVPFLTPISVPFPALTPFPGPAPSTAPAEPSQSRDCALDHDERGQGFPAEPSQSRDCALDHDERGQGFPAEPSQSRDPAPARDERGQGSFPIPALPPAPILTSAPLLTPVATEASTPTPILTPTATSSPSPAEPPQPRALDRDERGQGPTETSAGPWIEPEPSADYPVPGDLDSYVFSEALPALEDTPSGIPGAPDPRQGLAAPLPTASVPAVRRPGSPTLPEGDLALTGVPCVLAALHAARATGALTLVQPPARKLVLLEDGHPVFAASNVPSERFAARCVREGILGAEAIEVLAALIGPREPLNEALLARGLLDEARRSRMFGEQIREIVWSTFEWRTGDYRLLTGPRARRPIARVRIHTGDLILEGFRRTGTIERLREDLPAGLALARATAATFDLEELPMSGPEALMLSLADGTKTISDLVLLSAMDERSALAFLAGCRAIGVLDEVRRALAGTRRIGFM